MCIVKLLPALFFALLLGCRSEGPYNKTLYSKEKPSRVLAKENKKHQEKLAKQQQKRIKNHRLRTRD
jgi:hypothetical protein